MSIRRQCKEKLPPLRRSKTCHFFAACLASIAAIGSLVLLNNSRVAASTCARFPFEKSFMRADCVFTGVLHSVREIPPPEGYTMKSYDLEFIVIHEWKGVPGNRITVRVDGETMSSWERYWNSDLPEQYLVYAHLWRGIATTGYCGRTWLLRFAYYDRYALPDPIRSTAAAEQVAPWNPLTIEDLAELIELHGVTPYNFRARDFRELRDHREILRPVLERVIARGDEYESIFARKALEELMGPPSAD